MLFIDDIVKLAINAQAKLVIDCKRQMEYCIAQDDQRGANAYFMEYARQRAILKEMTSFATEEGIHIG